MNRLDEFIEDKVADQLAGKLRSMGHQVEIRETEPGRGARVFLNGGETILTVEDAGGLRIRVLERGAEETIDDVKKAKKNIEFVQGLRGPKMIKLKEQKLRQIVREEIQSVMQESESEMFALARMISDASQKREVEDLGRKGDIHKFRIGNKEYYATVADNAGQHTMP